VVWLFASVDLRALGGQLALTDWRLAAVSAAVNLASLWTRAWRWRWLFPPGVHPPGLVPAVMIGYMANNVLPLRAGEVVRVYVVSRRWSAAGAGERFWLVLATLVVERVLDSLTVVAILATLVLLISVPPALEWAAAVVLVIDAVAVAVLVATAARPGTTRSLARRLTRRWPRLERLATHVVDTSLRGLDGIRAPAHWPPLALWTAAAWVLPAAAAWLMLRAARVDVPFLAAWAVLAAVGLGVSIPSAPGYVGVWHAAAVLALGIFGVPPAVALGFALLLHASHYVPVTLVGWGYLVREHVSLGEAAHARRPATLDADVG